MKMYLFDMGSKCLIKTFRVSSVKLDPETQNVYLTLCNNKKRDVVIKLDVVNRIVDDKCYASDLDIGYEICLEYWDRLRTHANNMWNDIRETYDGYEAYDEPEWVDPNYAVNAVEDDKNDEEEPTW